MVRRLHGRITSRSEPASRFRPASQGAGLDDADWSFGDFMGQCAHGSAAKGISKDANGNVRSLLCCPVIPFD